MRFLDYALLALVALILFFALRRAIKKRGSGGCGCAGGCEHCASRGECEKPDRNP